MSGKIIAVLAALLMVAVGGAAFMYGGSGTNEHGDGGTNEGQPSAAVEEAAGEPQDEGSGSGGGVEEQSGGSAISAVPGLSIAFVSGTEGCCSIAFDEGSGEYAITFSGISEDTEYQVSGTLNGCIEVDAGDDFDFHEAVLWETGDFHAGPGGFVIAEKVSVKFIHGAEIRHILQKH